LVNHLISRFSSTIFADLCAGPGGFSEYILWRTSQKNAAHIHGVGFTLKTSGEDHTNFSPHRFMEQAQASERFSTHFGVPLPKDTEGDGDITKLENILSLSTYIDSLTDGSGAGLVTSDGGISVAGSEENQEELTRHLKLCEVQAMFHILATGGCYVLKVYDLMSPFMVGLIYILFCNFSQITIIKPRSSRPANSERYVVCKHLLERRPAKTLQFLQSVHDQLLAGVNVTQLISLEGTVEQSYLRYTKEINVLHAEQQLKSLKEMILRIQCPTSGSGVDADFIVSNSLAAWDLPIPMFRGRKY
jgi:23S rRNA U2552 (ribose-2'-O)-methylase RlmE/FtsJ